MAFDRNDQLASGRLYGVISAPAGSGALAEPIAGVAAVSRQLVEFARAGFDEVVVQADPAPSFAAAVRADLARAGRAVEVRFEPSLAVQSCVGGVLVEGAIVKASVLAELARPEDAPGSAQVGGLVVARRLAGDAGLVVGAGVVQLEARGAILLDSPDRASRMVLRETSKASDGLVSRWLNRPISRAISGWMLHWGGVRPGHATVLTALAALAMVLCLAHGTALSLALGCVMFHFASIVDGIDGEIARATFRTSGKGAALDTGVDMASNLLFAVGLTIGLTIGLTRLYGPAYVQLGAFCSVGLLIGILSMMLLSWRSPAGGRFDILKNAYGARAADGAGIAVVTAVRIATSRDFFAFAFAFAVLGVLGQARIIPWILAFGVALWLLIIAGGASIILSDEDAAQRP